MSIGCTTSWASSLCHRDSTARYFLRTLRSTRPAYNHILTAACIGEVCTHPSQQRQGHAKQVMEQLLKTAREAGCNVALLHTSQPHLQDYYARFGFQRLTNKEYFTLTVPQPSLPAEVQVHAAWRPETMPSVSAADVACMHRLHAARIASFSFSMIRPRDYWDTWMAAEMALPSRQLLVLRGDAVQGYAVVQVIAGGRKKDNYCTPVLT